MTIKVTCLVIAFGPFLIDSHVFKVSKSYFMIEAKPYWSATGKWIIVMKFLPEFTTNQPEHIFIIKHDMTEKHKRSNGRKKLEWCSFTVSFTRWDRPPTKKRVSFLRSTFLWPNTSSSVEAKKSFENYDCSYRTREEKKVLLCTVLFFINQSHLKRAVKSANPHGYPNRGRSK